MLTALQKKAAQAIINIFETGKVAGNYAAVVAADRDPGGLTYGRAQTTLNSGNLSILINDYCEAAGAAQGGELKKYRDRLRSKDAALNKDGKLHDLLREAGKDPVMVAVQDAFFDRIYWSPAFKEATSLSIFEALSVAVVYDSFIHGSWRKIRGQVAETVGSPAEIGEREWVRSYVGARRAWLATHPTIPLLHKTVYRMDAFMILMAEERWSLALPFTVRGVVVDADALGTSPLVRASALDEADVVLRQGSSGEAVAELQRNLNLYFAGASAKTLIEDGQFGPRTHALLTLFQEQEGLKADGALGPVSRTCLESVLRARGALPLVGGHKKQPARPNKAKSAGRTSKRTR